MGWPTYAFQFNAALAKGRLQEEYAARITRKEGFKDTNLQSLIAKLKTGFATFKQYASISFSDERSAAWTALLKRMDRVHTYEETDEQAVYPEIVQSRCAKNSKVKMGMRHYKLQRASKYSNICRDCAAVLQFAPGLFSRTNAFVMHYQGRDADTSERGDRRPDWWSNIVRDATAAGIEFNPDVEFTSRNMKLPPEKLQAFRASMDIYAKAIQRQQKLPPGVTKYTSEPPDIYVASSLPIAPGPSENELLADVIKQLKDSIANSTAIEDTPAMRNVVDYVERRFQHEVDHRRDTKLKLFDPDLRRVELRNAQLQESVYNEKTKKYTRSGPVYQNCLVTQVYQPKNGLKRVSERGEDDYVVKEYYATRKKDSCDGTSSWCGDAFVTEYDDTKGYHVTRAITQSIATQVRQMRQSRFFITYSLHRPIEDEMLARVVMERMASAVNLLFGNDSYLKDLLVFGKKINKNPRNAADVLGKGDWMTIVETRKKAAMQNFYGGAQYGLNSSSYVYDTYETHVSSVNAQIGVELGPKRHHPHFHCVLTVNHFSYVHFDYFRMVTYLEMMFTGRDVAFGWGEEYKLPAGYYTDAELPWVDIRMYPQDNYLDVLLAYIRKNATPGPIEAAKVR
jgi:hypothetical protein